MDKSELIAYTNEVILTNQQYLCVSRPRRFGKSMTIDMLAAYYSQGNDAEEQFRYLKIAKTADYRRHMNRYHVICVNMQEFFSNSNTVVEMITTLKIRLLKSHWL